MMLVSLTTTAGPVTPDEARQRIAAFMGSHRSASTFQADGRLKLVATSHYQESPAVAAPCYYVFNVGESSGYVIAGADDRIPAVLGYADSGTFDPQHLPANMEAWLRGYNDQMEYLNRHPEAAVGKVVAGDEISPLLESQWNQGYPYNLLCPMDGEKRSVTGCVATAMAQVMYYWKYPSQTTTLIPGYISEEKEFNLPAIAAGTPIDWDHMLPRYSEQESDEPHQESDEQQRAVAELMLICGTSVRMDYSASGSGAYSGNVATALRNYLDYDAATYYKSRDNYRQAAWNQMVYDELKARRPVYYSGQSSGGGHAFVIDGYGGDDYFHVNWGWGGGSDNYFLLSILDPDNNSGIGASTSTDGYSFDQGAIFGAQPNTGVIPVTIPLLDTDRVGITGDAEVTRLKQSMDFTVEVNANYWNMTGNTHHYEFGYAVYDADGQQLTVKRTGWTYNLETGTGYGSLNFELSFGAGETSGTWFLKPVCRIEDSETWLPNKGTDFCFITVTIDGNSMKLVEPTFGLTGTFEATGKTEALSDLPLTATVANEGTLWHGQLFLLVDGERICGRHFDIDAGETTNLDFSFVPKEAGDKVIELCTRSWNGKEEKYEYLPFISTVVTVAPPPAFDLSMTPTTKNTVSEDGKRVIKGSTALIGIKVVNKGSNDYDNAVIVQLYKYTDDSHGSFYASAQKTIQLAAEETTNVELQIDELVDGRYFYYVYYISEGKKVKGYDFSPSFYVMLPDGITCQPQTAGNDTVTVYTLDGNQVATARGHDVQRVVEALPKGIYVVRQGKKTKIRCKK